MVLHEVSWTDTELVKARELKSKRTLSCLGMKDHTPWSLVNEQGYDANNGEELKRPDNRQW